MNNGVKTFLTKYIVGALFISHALSVSAQSYEDEIRAQLEADVEAWNTADIENINSDSFSIGYGFRSYLPRTTATRSPEADRALLKGFLDSLESYRIIPIERNITIEGEIALVWGSHIEEIKHIGRPRERVTVRNSATYKRNSDGTWQALLSHRDIQKFGDDGRYIPEYAQ